MTFSIRVSTDDLHRPDGSAIVWGRFWFEFGEEAFPSVGWGDAIDPALVAWLREARTLAAGMPGTATLDFMDGPFRAQFAAEGDGTLGARCGERGRRDAQRHAVDRAAFVAALAGAVAQLIGAYEARGWDGSELRRIQGALPRPASRQAGAAQEGPSE